MGSIGDTTGGTITVNSGGGNILWSNDPVYTAFTDSQTGLANGGSNTQTLTAQDFFFTSTGAGSIGTDARPLQITTTNASDGVLKAELTLNARFWRRRIA